ncbi:MAG TPA: DoxX family protein [Burkholderiaceae bacterium]|jgi:putative oxidoreductase
MLGQRSAIYAPLFLRVTLGAMFIAHLYWKFALLPGGLETWWSNFAANGYPWFAPWYAISAEFAGALLLIPGICTRWVSLYAVPLMLGAAQFWAVRKGFYFTTAGAELPVIWAAMLLLQAMLGDGPCAVRVGRSSSGMRADASGARS